MSKPVHTLAFCRLFSYTISLVSSGDMLLFFPYFYGFKSLIFRLTAGSGPLLSSPPPRTTDEEVSTLSQSLSTKAALTSQGPSGATTSSRVGGKYTDTGLKIPRVSNNTQRQVGTAGRKIDVRVRSGKLKGGRPDEPESRFSNKYRRSSQVPCVMIVVLCSQFWPVIYLLEDRH